MKKSNAFYVKGNKATGTCLCKAFQDIKVEAQEGRSEVTELKNKENNNNISV